jgi:N-acetylmuramoyl-L-alanine amidase
MIFSWLDYVRAVATTQGIPAQAHQLRIVQLAQAIVESGRGTSQLFKEAGNPGGLKWRNNIDGNYTDKITHQIRLTTPSEPNGCDWCHWKTAEQAAMGYWRFITRPNSPYQGWETYKSDPDGYLQHIWEKGYASDPNYVSKVKKVFPEAQDLLHEYSIPKPPLSPQFKVAIMPGHGGSDPGAVNPQLKLQEKDYNWKEAIEIKSRLEATGNYQVILCRTENELAPLTTMQQRANESGANVCLCLHHNAVNKKAQGWWLFYINRSPKVEEFIKIMDKHFQGLSLPGRGYLAISQPFSQSWYKNVWNCIHNCNMPTILFESCFIDNDEDATWLRDGGYQQVAQKICAGVQEFLTRNPGKPVCPPPTKTIQALDDTLLKKDWSKQGGELDKTQKEFVPKGTSYSIQMFQESSLETPLAGHALIELANGTGEWYIFLKHWQLPWTRLETHATVKTLPEWNQVDWENWSSPVSRYFNVGEVTLWEPERIPSDNTERQNIIKIARKLDEVRQWWGSPLLVTSWYRPMWLERKIKGSEANHPFGFAVDLYPAKGSAWDFQSRFEQEWYKTGKWQGGFGCGANKGFIHLDLNPRLGQRTWPY